MLSIAGVCARAFKECEVLVCTIIRLPIAIISRTPTDAGDPTPVPVVVSAILILVVMPLVAVAVVMASVVIWVIPSMVAISLGRLRNKTGNTDHHG